MDAEELASRLRMLCQFLRFNVKCARRESLLQRDINAANPSVVHTYVRDEVSAFVSHCDVHGLANFTGFLLRRADYAAGIFQFHCGHGLSSYVLSGGPVGNPKFGTGVMVRDRRSFSFNRDHWLPAFAA